MSTSLTAFFCFCVRIYLEDFKFAVNSYVRELNTDLHKFNDARKALEKEAQLL